MGQSSNDAISRVENNTLGPDELPFGDDEKEHERQTGDEPVRVVPLNPGMEPVRDENGHPLTYAPGGGVPVSSGGQPKDGGLDKGSNETAVNKQNVINPATNKVVTDHIVVSSGKAPKTSVPNSIYEVSRADGTKSLTYYDSKGNMFSREDYGQQRTHGSLGYDVNGKVPPHEHKVEYNANGQPIGKYYREMDKNGKPVGPWVSEK
ncbi:hypothetical protein HVC08_002266 [Salmonella enterica]|nr:hypothetical protein [Salmonella enterica]